MRKVRFILTRTSFVAVVAVLGLADSARGHVGLNEPNGGEVLAAGLVFTIEW